ncbi:MAG TPA: hypothetical protein VEL74_23700 [Thermoanaerobaculia bacterium]|nr:hypothetical protein [Thermoanaerobaculia bacterium]
MLNLAGSSYDFGKVLFAVLQECEHRRRALAPAEAEQGLMEIARDKLAEIRESYQEAGGSRPYWEDLEHEVLNTALPQYIPRAVEQTRLEGAGYDVFRKGDPAARVVFGLLGLILGALLILLPPQLIVERGVAFLLAAVGVLYPEIKKGYHDYRFSKFLNRLIVKAEKYQNDRRLHYVSNARLEEELRSLETPAEKPREGATVHPFPKEPEGSGPRRGGRRVKG